MSPFPHRRNRPADVGPRAGVFFRPRQTAAARRRCHRPTPATAARPHRTRLPGSGTGATWNSQPKLAGGAPPKLIPDPAGLADWMPAAVERKATSLLPPTVGGLKVPWPKLFGWASVAPVLPLLSSNTTPAQKTDGRSNNPGASGTDVSRLTETGPKVGCGKARDNSRELGAPALS